MNDYQNTEENCPRKPLFAAMMSTALPGLGQLYNGEFNKAIWIFLTFSIVSIPLFVFVTLLLPASMTLLMVALTTLLSFAIWIYGIVDAWRVARKLQYFELQGWQTSGVYTLVFLICAMVILPSTVMWVRKHLVEPFYAPSQSMQPSVLQGDYFFAQKSYNCPNCWQQVTRGDVAIFVYPDNRSYHYVKRVIALPGDQVVLKGKTLIVNGERLNTDADPNTETLGERSWQVQWADEESESVYQVTVEPGHAFVLGDNRSRSNDSRVFGLVPLSDIVGKARQVWYSKSADTTRWSRVGRLLN